MSSCRSLRASLHVRSHCATHMSLKSLNYSNSLLIWTLSSSMLLFHFTHAWFNLEEVLFLQVWIADWVSFWTWLWHCSYFSFVLLFTWTTAACSKYTLMVDRVRLWKVNITSLHSGHDINGFKRLFCQLVKLVFTDFPLWFHFFIQNINPAFKSNQPAGGLFHSAT